MYARRWSSKHDNDVIMTTKASEITSLTVVYSTVYSDADQRKHQSSASLVFVWGIHRDRWIPRTNGQLRGKCFNLVTSSWGQCIHRKTKIVMIWILSSLVVPGICMTTTSSTTNGVNTGPNCWVVAVRFSKNTTRDTSEVRSTVV